MRATIGVTAMVLLAGACVPTNDQKTGDRGTLRAVALPDLSRLEESVQVQLREPEGSLSLKRNDPATPDADLGTEYGQMGTLLLAAELDEPAEAALLNPETLAPNEIRWPYYLGHLYRAKGDIPNAIAAFERALRSAPTVVPTRSLFGDRGLYAAVDFSFGLALGRTIGDVWSPYFGARFFGGPVWFTAVDRGVPGQDPDHHSMGFGSVFTFPADGTNDPNSA